MIDHTISSRYAKVLFDLDTATDSFKERLQNFERLIGILKENPKLAKLLRDPHVAVVDKRQALEGLFACDQTFMNFLFYLIQKGRLANLGQIASDYRLTVNKYFDTWGADIVTAIPLDTDSEAKLKQKLEKDFHKKITLTKKVDPTIIGGAILLIGNEMVDWSVRNRLKKLKEHLR
jgi:F-type H+-transporting ATPase subunit delta